MKRLYIATIVVAMTVLMAGAQQSSLTALEKLEAGSQVQQQPVIGVTKGGVRLYKEKDDLTSVIRIIPAKTEVEIVSNQGDYLLVKDGENVGYVETSKITVNQTTPPVQQKVVQQEVVQQQVVQQEVVRQRPDNRMTYLENKYGNSVAARIYAGKIWKGMTTEMVKDAWGDPDKVNKVVVKSVQMEEHIYRSTWLLIEKGVLKEWGPITK